MFWNEDQDGTPVMPEVTPASTVNPHFFQDGNPQTGLLATVVSADFMNILTKECLNILEAAEIAPNKLDHTQLLQAIRVIAAGSGGSYPPTPETLALRNTLGCTQVNDPVEDLDAANKRWVMNEIGGGGGGLNIEKPVITAPEADTVFQSLQVGVTVSALALAAGGTPEPAETQIRVLDEDGATVLGTETLAYTVTPSITVPESHVGLDVLVLVRHKDEVFGWSPWSDRLTVAIADVVQLPAKVTAPERYATGVSSSSLTVEIDEGEWTNGSTYAGSKTSLEIRKIGDNSLVYDSGWIDYATSIDLPAGTLDAGTQYWASARHRAASAPAANADALLDSPAVGRDNPNSSVFTTQPASAPDITGLTHTIPSAIVKLTGQTVTIFGATSTDGGTVTYDVTDIGNSITLSKYTGIGED
jgi:hypothetical protein